jgi:transcriptional regulator with XRE-family HTH domain
MTGGASKGGTELKISGSRVRALREQRFWSQEELASRAGLNRATVYKAEGGAGVSPRTGRALAAALNVDTTELLTGTKTGDARMQDRLAPRVARLEGLDLSELSGRLSELTDRLADLKELVPYKGGTKEEVRDWQDYEEITDEIRALSVVLQQKASKQLA